LVDIAPTALHYLKSAIPADCDGRVLTELFEPHSETVTRPIRFESVSHGPLPSAETEIHEDKGETEIEERLRALGYL
jgi:hypothetical protein